MANEGGILGAAALAVLAVGVLIFLLGGFFIVGAGERGVLMTFGSVEPVSYGEGLHFKIPIVQSVYIMDVKTAKFVDSTEASSSDLQVVQTDIALNYHINPELAHKLYQEIGVDYEMKVIDPAIKESVKASTAKYPAEDIINKRDELALLIRDAISEKLSARGIYIEAMSITNIQFSKSFNDAIEAKVTAQQLKLKAEWDLERVRVEAQQKVANANADAEAILMVAYANANATKVSGEASAYAIQKRADSLKANPVIVQLTMAEKWNGKMPNVMTGNGNAMLLDISGMAQNENANG